MRYLELQPDESSEQPDAYRRFVTDGFVVSRALVEDGDAVWMGGFIGDRLEAQMGLVDAGDGLGRFQAVETRPAARGQGLCGTLAYATARYGLEAMGAQELVIVADPAYVAIRIYESLGFSRVETQTAWETAGRG